MTTVIDGKAVAQRVREDVARGVRAFAAAHGQPPGLATVLVGGDPASAAYVAGKQTACAEVGMAGFAHDLPANATYEAVARLLDELNADPAVSGILCQLPLPGDLDGTELTNRIDPDKPSTGSRSPTPGGSLSACPGCAPARRRP